MSEIKIIKATENPLSADVVIYNDGHNTWIYDVGSSEESYEELQRIDDKSIVISHFHPDHMGNLNRLDYANLYIGKNTFKYTKAGTVIERVTEIGNVRIIPMPSSHAKGSLALQIGKEYLLIGDAIYPQYKGEKGAYNVQHLRAQIELVEAIDVKYIGISHREKFLYEKAVILKYLKNLYVKRIQNEPFIYN